MCGIVGYIGKENPTEILLKGLEKLEYRGYDSAGIALINQKNLQVYKEKGRIAELRKSITPLVGSTAGIGHTRWATHGPPNKVNAHPHQSTTNRFTLVHNGVIENNEKIKRELLSDVSFVSETDTETIVHLIEKFVQGGLEVDVAFSEALNELKGSYAIALLDSKNPNMIYVAKNKSPLLIGVGSDFNVVASDAMAMLQVTNQFIELMDKEVVKLTDEDIVIKNQDGLVVHREPYIAEMDANDIEKGTYATYMLKEIDEQPIVIRDIIKQYQNSNGELHVDQDILEAISKSDRIYIIACGTSYHAGLVAKDLIEKVAHIPTETHIASEFVYNTPLLSENSFFIYISQSGETADSRACLVETNKLGHRSLTITNMKSSTLSRESDYTMLLHAGPEIAVASTKAYTAQVAVLSILSSAIAKYKKNPSSFDLLKELAIVANGIESITNQKEKLESISSEYLATTANCFFIGRGLDYHTCLEGSLKLKEISYIQAEGFAGGELKHGTIALIEENTPVIALSTQENVNLNIRGNVKEVAARGANTCIISMEGLHEESDAFRLPCVHELLTPLVSVIPLQLISYYAALHRQCDVDKPRNLAKAVTVE
jgi:glutamine---fructose-6-phosphate transaminase (isomerizing)